MVEPEVGENLLQLALGEDGADEFGLGELVEDAVGGADAVLHGVEGFALARGEVGEQEVALGVWGEVGEGDAVGDGHGDQSGHALVFGQGEECASDACGGGLIDFFSGGDFGFAGVGLGVELILLFAEVLRDLDLVDAGEERIGGVGALAFGDLGDGVAVRVDGEDLLGRHVEGGKVVEAAGEGLIGDGRG